MKVNPIGDNEGIITATGEEKISGITSINPSTAASTQITSISPQNIDNQVIAQDQNNEGPVMTRRELLWKLSFSGGLLGIVYVLNNTTFGRLVRTSLETGKIRDDLSELLETKKERSIGLIPDNYREPWMQLYTNKPQVFSIKNNETGQEIKNTYCLFADITRNADIYENSQNTALQPRIPLPHFQYVDTANELIMPIRPSETPDITFPKYEFYFNSDNGYSLNKRNIRYGGLALVNDLLIAVDPLRAQQLYQSKRRNMIDLKVFSEYLFTLDSRYMTKELNELKTFATSYGKNVVESQEYTSAVITMYGPGNKYKTLLFSTFGLDRPHTGTKNDNFSGFSIPELAKMTQSYFNDYGQGFTSFVLTIADPGVSSAIAFDTNLTNEDGTVITSTRTIGYNKNAPLNIKASTPQYYLGLKPITQQ